MTNKRNAPTREATRAEATETAAFGEAAASMSDCIIGDAGRQREFIENLLLHGAENALTISDLHRLTGVNKRAIRAEIQRERLRGVPILSDNSSGYFLPANDQERKQCVRSLRHRAGEIFRTAAAIERGGR